MPLRLHLVTPDAQYLDDAEIERRTAGPDVDWTICRERDVNRLPVDALARADGIVSWHEMPIDAGFVRRADARRLSVETAILYLTKGHLRNLVNEPYLATARV